MPRHPRASLLQVVHSLLDSFLCSSSSCVDCPNMSFRSQHPRPAVAVDGDVQRQVWRGGSRKGSGRDAMLTQAGWPGRRRSRHDRRSRLPRNVQKIQSGRYSRASFLNQLISSARPLYRSGGLHYLIKTPGGCHTAERGPPTLLCIHIGSTLPKRTSRPFGSIRGVLPRIPESPHGSRYYKERLTSGLSRADLKLSSSSSRALSSSFQGHLKVLPRTTPCTLPEPVLPYEYRHSGGHVTSCRLPRTGVPAGPYCRAVPGKRASGLAGPRAANLQRP